MKLYTEEQVRRAMYEVCDYYVREYQDEILESLTTIELPSDEEIEKEWNDERLEQLYIDGAIDGAIEGAKWMKEQITKQL